MRRVLLLYRTPHPRSMRLSTAQHLAALRRIDGEVVLYNANHGAPSWLRGLRFDAIILHETLLSMRWSPWFQRLKRRLDWVSDVAALKVAFPQDDYDHAHVLDDWLSELGVGVVCSILDDRHRGDVYPSLVKNATFYETLTGYIDEDSAERFRTRMTPAEARPYDIVYRAKQHPFLYGSQGRQKYAIGIAVADRSASHGLTCDISTRSQETVLGDAWLDFMGSARATIGTESGSSVLDRRGEIHRRVEEVLTENPSATFDEVSARMPPGWDDHEFFVVSPRHLEAVVTKTAQILVRGQYSGVLQPERHYVPIAPDFSDLDDALEQVRDIAHMKRIAERVYEDVYLSGLYTSARLTDLVETVLEKHGGPALRAKGRSRLVPPAQHLAAAQAEIERTVVAPTTFAVLVAKRNYRDVAAVLRLVVTDSAVRRLVRTYLSSTYTREHVSPRVALVDFLCLGELRRIQVGKADGDAPFRVSMEIDEHAQRITLRSIAPELVDQSPSLGSENSLSRLLRDSAWEFDWDHSGVDGDPSFPIFGSHAARLPLLGGRRALTTLNGLARIRPDQVARALAPFAGTPHET